MRAPTVVIFGSGEFGAAAQLRAAGKPARVIRGPAVAHGGENIAVEHASDRHAVGGGFHMGGSPDRIYQRLAMMRSRAANQRAIDVKQHQGAGMFQVSL